MCIRLDLSQVSSAWNETQSHASVDERAWRGDVSTASTLSMGQVFSPAVNTQLQVNSWSTTESGSDYVATKEEAKLVEVILNQLAPMVKNRVTMEIRRVRAGRSEHSNGSEGYSMSILPEVLRNMMFADGTQVMSGLASRY